MLRRPRACSHDSVGYRRPRGTRTRRRYLLPWRGFAPGSAASYSHDSVGVDWVLLLRDSHDGVGTAPIVLTAQRALRPALHDEATTEPVLEDPAAG